MAKVYSWYLYTDKIDGEQYGYIINPKDAQKLLNNSNNGGNSGITNDITAYIGNRLSGDNLVSVKKWTKLCSEDEYKTMFERLTDLIKSLNNDVNLGSVENYNDVPGTIDDLRGPRGRGVKKIEFLTPGALNNIYRIIFDDGSTDTFTMPRPKDGQDGKDGEPADTPTLQVTKTLYASGLIDNKILIPNKPSGGSYDFEQLKLIDVNFNGSNWNENNSGLAAPIFQTSCTFYSNNKRSTWSEPLQITGNDGKPGSDGNSVEFIYYLNDIKPTITNNVNCYKGNFKYYEKINNVYVLLNTKPYNINSDDIEIVYEVDNSFTKRYLKVWTKPNDIDSENCEDKTGLLYDSINDSLKDGDEVLTEIIGKKYITVTNDENKKQYYIWGEYLNEYVPNGWTDSPTGVDENNKTEWCATRRRNSETKKWGAWSTPQIWSKYGEKGEDGDGVEYIYLLGDSTPPKNPTPKDYENNENYQNKNIEWVPSGESSYININGETIIPSKLNWKDEPESVSPDNMYLWMSSRKYRKIGNKHMWSAFSNPSLWAKYGESGKSAYITREIYYMNDDTSDIPTPPSGAALSAGWSVGFPTDYTTGKVVWGSKAELNGDTGGFFTEYSLVSYGKIIDSIEKINTAELNNLPSEANKEIKLDDGTPCKYLYITEGNETGYYKFNGTSYEKLNDTPRDSFKKSDRKYLVLSNVPTEKQEDYELIKVEDNYYYYNDDVNKYVALNGTPNSILLGEIKGINTIKVDTLPTFNNGYDYLIYGGEYYTWKSSKWCDPYLVTGLKGEPAAPIDRTVDFFCYYNNDETPTTPTLGQVIRDDSEYITGQTIPGIVDYWYKVPSISAQINTKRWYRCTGIIKGETQKLISCGNVLPVNGLDGTSYVYRYCVTYTANPPTVTEENAPKYYINDTQTGWFLLENIDENKQYQELLIDGFPPMGGAVWRIQAKVNKNGNLLSSWSNPERINGYPGERGPEGPAGRRGATGIPGATLNSLYCLGTYDNDNNTLGYFFDEVVKNGSVEYNSNGYFGETPSIEFNNDKLKNWFTSPPDANIIVVKELSDLTKETCYANLGRIVDYVNNKIINGFSVTIHNYYLIIETDIPIGLTQENSSGITYYNEFNFNKGEQLKNGNKVIDFIIETCYYKWSEENKKYTLFNGLPNLGNNELVKNVTKIPTGKVADFAYLKKVNYYKWDGSSYEIYNESYNIGNYKIDKQVIKEDINGDDELKKLTPYIWTTQGSKHEVYDNINSYINNETPYSGQIIPDYICDINVGKVNSNPTTLGYKDSRYKYLLYNNEYYIWSDSKGNYVLYSLIEPVDALTNISDVNTIEYLGSNNYSKTGFYAKYNGNIPDDVITEETLPINKTGEYISVHGEYYKWVEFAVATLPHFNLTECVFLKQTKNNSSKYYKYVEDKYYDVTSSESINATRDNTLVVSPNTTIDELPDVSKQYKYFKEYTERANHLINQTEYYFKYYSWGDTPDNLLKTKVSQVDWCTPFRLQGANGLTTAGNRGQVVYPMGVYNENEVYRTTDTKAPYVLDPNDGLYYVYNIVGTPWVGVLPENYTRITENPSDASSKNTKIISNSDDTLDWYDKNYEVIQLCGYYIWDNSSNKYINECIPSGATGENTYEYKKSNDSVPSNYEYYIKEGRYYKKDNNGNYIIYFNKNENDLDNYLNVYSKEVPTTKYHNYDKIKVYFNYTWSEKLGKYKASSSAVQNVSVHILPSFKVGYKYFITEENNVKKYYKYNFSNEKLVDASVYKYSKNGYNTDWILEQGDGGITTPATNYANAIANNTEPAWVRFEHFNALYASIGIIANGMIGSSVYNNEFMYSQQGQSLIDGKRVDGGYNYEDFLSAYKFDENKGVSGAWTYNGNIISDTSVNPYDDKHGFWPNVCINFKTGQMWLSCGKIKFGAFANNGSDISNSSNITTQDVIKEWGDDNKLSPMERSILRETFKELESKYKEAQESYITIYGSKSNELCNAYESAQTAYSAHTIDTAIEVYKLPSEKTGKYDYIKYNGEFYKYDENTINSVYAYQKVSVEEVEGYNDIKPGNKIVKLLKNSTNNSGYEYLAGFYKVTGSNIDKLNYTIVLGIPSNVTDSSDEYISFNGELYHKTQISFPYIKIAGNIDGDIKLFTSGDTMDTYKTGDKAYSGISNYYEVQAQIMTAVTSQIKTDTNEALNIAQSAKSESDIFMNTFGGNVIDNSSGLSLNKAISIVGNSGSTAILSGLSGSTNDSNELNKCLSYIDSENKLTDRIVFASGIDDISGLTISMYQFKNNDNIYLTKSLNENSDVYLKNDETGFYDVVGVLKNDTWNSAYVYAWDDLYVYTDDKLEVKYVELIDTHLINYKANELEFTITGETINPDGRVAKYIQCNNDTDIYFYRGPYEFNEGEILDEWRKADAMTVYCQYFNTNNNVELTYNGETRVSKYHFASTIITEKGVLINNQLYTRDINANSIKNGATITNPTIEMSTLNNTKLNGGTTINGALLMDVEVNEGKIKINYNDKLVDSGTTKKEYEFKQLNKEIWNNNNKNYCFDIKGKCYETSKYHNTLTASTYTISELSIENTGKTNTLIIPPFELNFKYTFSKKEAVYKPIYQYNIEYYKGDNKTRTETLYAQTGSTPQHLTPSISYKIGEVNKTIETGVTNVKITMAIGIHLEDRAGTLISGYKENGCIIKTTDYSNPVIYTGSNSIITKVKSEIGVYSNGIKVSYGSTSFNLSDSDIYFEIKGVRWTLNENGWISGTTNTSAIE